MGRTRKVDYDDDYDYDVFKIWIWIQIMITMTKIIFGIIIRNPIMIYHPLHVSAKDKEPSYKQHPSQDRSCSFLHAVPPGKFLPLLSRVKT